MSEYQILQSDIIITFACNYYNVTKDELQSASKLQAHVRPRQFVFYMLKNYSSLTAKEIGGIFGFRHYTTILYGAERFSGFITLRRDRECIDVVEKCVLRLRSEGQ